MTLFNGFFFLTLWVILSCFPLLWTISCFIFEQRYNVWCFHNLCIEKFLCTNFWHLLFLMVLLKWPCFPFAPLGVYFVLFFSVLFHLLPQSVAERFSEVYCEGFLHSGSVFPVLFRLEEALTFQAHFTHVTVSSSFDSWLASIMPTKLCQG